MAKESGFNTQGMLKCGGSKPVLAPTKGKKGKQGRKKGSFKKA